LAFSTASLFGKWRFDIAGIDGNDHIVRNLHASQPADFPVDLTRKLLIIQVSRQPVFDLDEGIGSFNAGVISESSTSLAAWRPPIISFNQSLFGLGQSLDNDS